MQSVDTTGVISSDMDAEVGSGVFWVRAYKACKALKTILKAEINHEARPTLNINISRPFYKPSTG